jgi:hypothetical protein
MITLKLPVKNFAERKWAAQVAIEFWAQLPLKVELHEGPPTFCYQDHVLTTAESTELKSPRWLEAQTRFPVFFGLPVSDEKVCHADLLWQIYFFLSGHEGAHSKKNDRHERFPAEDSQLVIHGLIETPVVDMTVDYLWRFFERAGLEPKRTQGKIRLTTDVDHPFDPSARNVLSLSKELARDLLRRKDPVLALKRTANALASPFGQHSLDPHNTFRFMAEAAKGSGASLHAYILDPVVPHHLDGPCAKLGETPDWVLQEALKQGFTLGTHGSYASLHDFSLLEQERAKLEKRLQTFDAKIVVNDNRQHYLRWSDAHHPRALQEAGFIADSSVGFSSRPGFRAGTTRPFPLWDHQKKEGTSVIEMPLIAMESSFLEKKGLDLRSADAVALMRSLKKTCLDWGGTYTLLWHQNRLQNGQEREWLQEVLRA